MKKKKENYNLLSFHSRHNKDRPLEKSEICRVQCFMIISVQCVLRLPPRANCRCSLHNTCFDHHLPTHSCILTVIECSCLTGPAAAWEGGGGVERHITQAPSACSSDRVANVHEVHGKHAKDERKDCDMCSRHAPQAKAGLLVADMRQTWMWHATAIQQMCSRCKATVRQLCSRHTVATRQMCSRRATNVHGAFSRRLTALQ